ncbi:MAG: hypothetical protein KGH79_02970 [Patescibacteria group bacterium]|nr:hypothetical protein [Patescibacteria group bacterium]
MNEYMNRVSALLIVLLLLAGGTWYWWSMRSSVPPTVTIIIPAGGEAWQPGEEHTISWDTHGVPANDKISLTIRRIPPPPLQEEGQEFDPIIFTDLPNTGSTTWKVSAMYPSGTYVLGISAYESVPITNAISAESAQFSITHPTLSADLYPLYGRVDWSASEVESFIIGTTSYSGASITSAAVADTMDPGSVFTPFERYYDQKLKSIGWRVANDLAAGGHVGGQTGYRKGGAVILTRFQIVYHTAPENAPSECPCDVMLSLFSTGNK